MGIQKGTSCLNCQEEFKESANFCPNCGQKNNISRLKLGDVLQEGLSVFFSYDSKLYRTIWELIIRPGELSTKFILGQRQRFLNPFRLYFSISLIYFLLSAVVDDYGSLDNHSLETEDDVVSYRQIMQDVAAADSTSVSFYEGTEGTYAERVRDADFVTRTLLFCDYQDSTKQMNVDSALIDLELENTKWNVWHYKKSWKILQCIKNPQRLSEQFISKTPIMLVLVMPIFTLFLLLFYYKQDKSYMDHLIFIFNSQTAFFILLLITLIPEIFGLENTGRIAVIIFLIYLYKGMRNFYKQSRFITVLKLGSLTFIYSILMVFLFILAIPFILFA